MGSVGPTYTADPQGASEVALARASCAVCFYRVWAGQASVHLGPERTLGGEVAHPWEKLKAEVTDTVGRGRQSGDRAWPAEGA